MPTDLFLIWKPVFIPYMKYNISLVSSSVQPTPKWDNPGPHYGGRLGAEGVTIDRILKKPSEKFLYKFAFKATAKPTI